MEPYQALIKRIKELMKKEKLTKYKLSIQSGLPNSTILNIMNGRTKKHRVFEHHKYLQRTEYFSH